MEVDQWCIARLSSFGHRSILVYVFSVQCRFIANKETFPFSLFETHGCRSIVHSDFVILWPYKHSGICFSVHRRFKPNKEKGDVSFLLI